MKVVDIWVKNIKEEKYKIEDVPSFMREDVILALKDELLDKESNLFIGESSLLTILKEVKIEKLKHICNQKIIDGFALDEEHYSYSQEKQINFQDTYQLFLNNMIAEIAWNAYVDDEKMRVLLDKDKFQRVYLAGVKHKQDCIIHLNDILIPLVESSIDIEALRAISWGEKKSSFRVSNEKNIAKKLETLSEDSVAQKSINEQMEDIVLEIADIALMSGL